MNQNIDKLDQQIYCFVVDTIGFLNTLKKKNLQNTASQTLATLTNTLNKKFNDFYELKTNQNEIKNVLTALLEQIKFILIKEFEQAEISIIHEKADLLIEAANLKKTIEEIL
jgi:hypothetical protein